MGGGGLQDGSDRRRPGPGPGLPSRRATAALCPRPRPRFRLPPVEALRDLHLPRTAGGGLSTIPAAGAAAFSEKIEEKARDARAFAWSASRHDTFATCPRKYYYSYYGILEDPEVQRLKQLSALALWAGSVVHETIEDFLRTSDEIPEPAVQEALIRSVVHERMLKEWKQSEGGTEGFRLFEHEYTQPIEQEDKKILVGIVMRSLRNFFKSPLLREAFKVKRSAWLSMEELVSFHVDDVPVFLRMDLAFRDERGRVRIVDWKTGRRAGKFNDVQIAGYALYAAEKGWAG